MADHGCNDPNRPAPRAPGAQDGDLVLLGVVEVLAARQLVTRLGERGVALTLAGNPATCSTGGCSPSVEVWAYRGDLPAVAQFQMEQREKQLSGLTFDPEVVGAVYDASRGEAQCPACGTTFATTTAECPDCGLMFPGGPE
jgi:hypothetical protein